MSDARCEEFRELVSAFVDEGLEAGELLRLEAHVAVCPGCRAFEGEVRRFGDLLRAAEVFRPLRRPPAGFAALVASRAAQAPAPIVSFPPVRDARRVSRLPWLGMIAAAAAAALFFGWSWQRLLPADTALQERLVRSAPPAAGTAIAAADEGSMDGWVREHAMLARGNTILGPAEEIEFADFRAVAGPGR